MSKDNNFNIIRWIGIVLVLYGHQFILLGMAPPVIWGNPIQGLGVNILFAISGYLVYKSYKNSRGFGEYLKKRIVRIFPMLIFIVILTVFIGAFFTTVDNKTAYFKYSLSYVIYNCLLSPRFELPGVFIENYYPAAVNGSLWTLPIEFACYLILPLIYLMCNRKRGKILFTAVLAGGFAICHMLYGGMITESLVIWGTDWIAAWKLAIYFFVGMGIAACNIERFFNIQVAVLLIFILACTINSVTSSIMIIVITYTVFSFAFVEKPFFSGFMNQLECSYGMYLWGFIVQQALINIICIRFGKNIHVNIMFLLSVSITFILSASTYYLIERKISSKAACLKGR